MVEDAHASKTVQAADQGGIHPIHALLNISAAAQSRKLKRRKVSRQFSTSANGVFRGFGLNYLLGLPNKQMKRQQNRDGKALSL